MTFHLYTAGSKRPLVDPQAYTGGQKRPVQVVYAYTGGARRLVWTRQALAVMTFSWTWDDVTVRITPPGTGADSYIIYRDNVEIATSGDHGTLTWQYVDTGALFPGQTVTYWVQAYQGGMLVGQVFDSVTTAQRADMGATATATAFDTIHLTWPDPAGGSVDAYEMWQTKPSVAKIYGPGPAKSMDHVGLSAGTSYAYEVTAFRHGDVISKDQCSATTPVRTTSTGTVWGPAQGSGFYWTGGTAQSLSGGTFSLPVTGWVTDVSLLISGKGQTGSCAPQLGGKYAAPKDLTSTPSGSPGWNGFGHPPNPDDWKFTGGVPTSIGGDTGGQAGKATQWRPYSGGGSNTVTWGQVNYWFYTSTLRGTPWWRDDWEGVDVHVDSWVDEAGATRRVRVSRPDGAVLGDWEA